MATIEPCPFCGNRGTVMGRGPSIGQTTNIWLACTACGASGPWRNAGFHPQSYGAYVMAVEAWNEREGRG